VLCAWVGDDGAVRGIKKKTELYTPPPPKKKTGS
jgi:hypothetical protein